MALVGIVRLRAGLVLLFAAGGTAGCGGGGAGHGPIGASAEIECAPFARQMTGLQLYGDAASWWDQAASRYARRPDPVEGGVLVFQRSGRLPHGHVSVVARLVSGREIRVMQANWVHHRITRDEAVVDVSPDNDWSRVRVWWAPTNTLGTSEYSTYGFIAADRPRLAGDLVAGLAPGGMPR